MGQLILSLYLCVSLASSYSASCASAALCALNVLFLVYLRALIIFLSFPEVYSVLFADGWILRICASTFEADVVLSIPGQGGQPITVVQVNIRLAAVRACDGPFGVIIARRNGRTGGCAGQKEPCPYNPQVAAPHPRPFCLPFLTILSSVHLFFPSSLLLVFSPPLCFFALRFFFCFFVAFFLFFFFFFSFALCN